MITFETVNELTLKVTCSGNDVIYTKAGCEIAVATTKAYLSQITVLSLIALKLSNKSLNAPIFPSSTWVNISSSMFKSFDTSLRLNPDDSLVLLSTSLISIIVIHFLFL